MTDAAVAVSGWAHSGEVMGRLLGPVFDASLRCVSLSDLPWSEELEAGRIAIPATALENLAESTGAGILAGWSCGAMLAMEAAAALGPRIRGLILLSPTPRFVQDTDWEHGVRPAALRNMIRRLRTDPAETLREFFQACRHPCSEELETGTGTAEAGPTELLSRQLIYLRDSDLRESARRIHVPVLVIHGQEDRIVPAGASAELQRMLPSCRRRQLPGIGHSLPDLAPEWCREVITEWLHTEIGRP